MINPQRIAEVLDSLDADVIALQEIDMENGRTHFSDQARSIAYWLSKAENVPWKYENAPAIDFEEGKYGNALLYRSDKVDLKNFKAIELPGAKDGDGKRSAGIAEFVVDGNKIQFVTTHFTHKNIDVDGKTLQIKTFEELNKNLASGLPTFIAADFNATVDPAAEHNASTFEAIKKDGWRIDSAVEGQSVPEAPRVIDYIISKNADKFVVKDKTIIHNKLTDVASDHYPIKVVYDV